MLSTNTVVGVRILVKYFLRRNFNYPDLPAFICSASILGFVLLDPSDDASLDNVMAEDASFKKSIFTNPRYRKHMEVLLPWLKHRGALE